MAARRASIETVIRERLKRAKAEGELPSNADPAFSMTVVNAAASSYGLRVGLMWFIPGMLLTSGYFIYTYRNFSGKVNVARGGVLPGESYPETG